MKLGISKALIHINIWLNIYIFELRRRILGFENANTFLRQVDKNTMISILRKNGAKIGINCDIEAPLIFHNCHYFSNLEIGSNVHIGKDCFFDLQGKVVIEDNVVISMRTTIITHIDLYKSDLKSIFPKGTGNVTIKKNTYLGVNSTILKDVIIGENCLVAAGCIVYRDVEPYTMVGGVPARVIKNLKILDGK